MSKDKEQDKYFKIMIGPLLDALYQPGVKGFKSLSYGNQSASSFRPQVAAAFTPLTQLRCLCTCANAYFFTCGRLFGKTCNLLRIVLGALRNISQEEENQQALLDHKALEPLFGLLRKGHLEQQLGMESEAVAALHVEVAAANCFLVISWVGWCFQACSLCLVRGRVRVKLGRSSSACSCVSLVKSMYSRMRADVLLLFDVHTGVWYHPQFVDFQGQTGLHRERPAAVPV